MQLKRGIIRVLLIAVAFGCASNEREPAPDATVEIAEPEVPDSVRAQIALRTVALTLESLRDSVQDALAVLRTEGTTPPLNLATLRSNYSGDRDLYDGEYKGTRITAASGLSQIASDRAEAVVGATDGCRAAAAVLPDSIRALPDRLHPQPAEICSLYLSFVGVRPPLEQIDEFFARRRASEVAKVFEYLRGVIEPLRGYLSADRERAILYVGRLASELNMSDGPLGEKVVSFAEEAIKWRNAQVEAGKITSDMRAELEARAHNSAMEASFRQNMAISSGIRSEKGARNAYQRAEAWSSVCEAAVREGLVSASEALRRGC